MKKLPYSISKYIDDILTEQVKANKNIKAWAKYVLNCFKAEDIYADVKQFDRYLSLEKYFYFQLYDWQKCLIGLFLCTYWRKTNTPRWSDLIVVGGRGMGKDGTIAYMSTCVTSPYNGIDRYDVDICANNEEQSKRPVFDIIEAFEQPKNLKIITHFFGWTKEQVRCKTTKSTIKGRTNNPKGRDGMRSGMAVFNEVHQYENYDNITVFTTGLGKVAHPRRLYFTSQGELRGGVIDDLIKQGEEILHGEMNDNGKMFLLYRLDDKEEVHEEANWIKANPSIEDNLTLLEEVRKEYREWKEKPHFNASFMTKRMCMPANVSELAVTAWENLEKCNKEIPDLTGSECTVGIDYAKTTDLVSVNAHFRIDDNRYDINHSWLCLRSADLNRIKAPYREWASLGLITLVDDDEIHPSYITDYIQELKTKYVIKKIAIDDFRFSLLAKALRDVGFSREDKNLKMVRPSDIMRTAPVIDSCFSNGYFHWNNNRVLMWATNNTKLIRHNKNVQEDMGNFVYGKIEGRSRKTDPFMALVASMTIEEELDTCDYTDIALPVFTC